MAEECISDAELRNLLKHRPHPVAYDGFEPSGRMHIAQGVMKAINVNRLTKAGCTFKFWVADWFAQLNNKMGGDLKKIQTVGKYMVEVRGEKRGREGVQACALWRGALRLPEQLMHLPSCLCLLRLEPEAVSLSLPVICAGVEGSWHGSHQRGVPEQQ